MSLSRALVSAWRGLAPDDIPEDVAAVARLHILDALGVGLAAASGAAGKTYHDALRRLGSAGAATVLGSGAGATTADAALANGGLIHALEFDDTHMGSIVHGSSVLLPAALAAAEAAGVDGGRLLAAYVKGWEALVRIGLAAPVGFQCEGFQITVTAGVMVAALIAADLTDASEEESVHALGVALSQASGVFEFLTNGSTVKSLHPGWAAHGGLVAAALACSGLTGPQTALDGRFGLFARFAGDVEAGDRLDAGLRDFGRRWHLRDAAFKFFPCCHYIHPYLTALDDAQARGITVHTIDRVTCLVAPGAAPIISEPWERRLAPSSAHEMRYSLPVVLALRLTKGRLGLDAFETLPAADVLALARRFEQRPLEANNFPGRFEAVLEIHLRDGSSQRIEIDDVRGGPRYPATEEQVLAKFRDNAGRLGSDADCAALERSVLDLGKAPVGDLAAALRRFAR